MLKSKVFLAAVLVAILTLSVFSFTACNDKDKSAPAKTDDDYTLTLSGMVDASGKTLADVVITKKQIKELYKTKPVNFTEDDPAVASDKTDDEGNPIPHTVKGVYLEDLMAEFSESVAIQEYGSLTLNATDGYVTVATADVFDSNSHGSKMVVAFEYDGVALTEKEKSGALRAVFDGQIANVWAKKLNVVEFSTDILSTPLVYSFSVLETLDEATYGGSYEALDNTGTNCTYSGIKIEKLFGNTEDAVLHNISEADKMCVLAWDSNSNGEITTYNEYKVWTKYDVFSGGYILNSGIAEGDDESTLTRTPVFDGPTFGVGMTVKNMLSISVFHSAVVSLETAMKRYDGDDADETFNIKNLLLLLNMDDEDYTYTVTKADGTTVNLTYAQMTAAKVSRNAEEEYTLTYNSNVTIEFTRVSAKDTNK